MLPVGKLILLISLLGLLLDDLLDVLEGHVGVELFEVLQTDVDLLWDGLHLLG